MAVTWITPAGSLGIVTERISLEIPLVASSPTRTVTFELLAGSLPRGLRLDNGAIKGSPVEVVKFTESKFVVRASDGIDIEDRTFTMSVDGADAPQWLTKEGFLNVGLQNAYYVLDNAYVDFQLEAEDNDVIAGDVLEYYLQPMDGELPPGLVLTNDGRIYGYTDPIFAVENQNSYTGGYDTSAFDILPLDKIEARSNGFDDYLYDVTTYDYSEESRTPRRLSRFYTFLITVSDGRTQSKRLFRIYVVTEEFLKSDNSIVQVDTNVFQASSSSNRLPLWVTESNLGRHRANNYLTIFLDVYRAPGITGTLVYFLSDKNPDGTTSVLPPGMTLDQITGEVAGKVPYQRAVTRPFTFSVIAANFLVDVVTVSYILKGAWKAATLYQINDAVVYNNIVWVCIQVGKNATPTEEPDYWQSSAAISEKTFTIQIIGEIESAIEWITDEDLGTIKANTPSQLTLRANSLLYGNSTLFDLVSGTLPPGLSLLGTGEIQGKVKQFADDKGSGLTRFADNIKRFPVLQTQNFRRFDGRYNNLVRPNLNSVGSSFGRIGPTTFADGMHSMPVGFPNPRTISNIVVDGGSGPTDKALDTNALELSAWMYVWGQFVTHDIGFEDVGARGVTDNISITVPAGDVDLTPGSVIPMTRVTVDRNNNAINDVTGWLDGSVIYGLVVPPDVPQPNNPFRNPIDLREGGNFATTGKLLTSAGNNLPIVNGEFFAGDPRSNENPDLISIHTLMVREHNWHVDALKAVNTSWTGEDFYQHAKAVVTAEFQQITYNEWLPRLLGPNALPLYQGYDPTIDATIPIEFDAAALRFGHSIVSAAVTRVDNNGNDVGPFMSFKDAGFMIPSEFNPFGGADGFIRHISADLSNELDVYIIDDLRNFLNDPPVSLDLASINIQRGRDLGLGTLNQTRIALGLEAYADFNEITSDTVVAGNLRTAYVDINKVELWIGGLAENHYNGGFLGRTFHEIVKRCFIKLRDGDRLYWENQGFEPALHNWVKNTTLADIILRNTDTAVIQAQVFDAAERPTFITDGTRLAVKRSSPYLIANTVTDPTSYNTDWDTGTTTFDKIFTFEVMARDTARFAESIKKFRVAVVNENVKAFANLYVKPLQKKAKRLNWFNFITDSSIFKPKEIYRFGDPNFGVQTELKVLLFAGIESTDAINFVQAMSRNHGKKRLNFGAVKSAKAKDPITQETIYEAIYVEIVDPLEQNGVTISQTVELPNDISSPVLVSYNDIKVDSDIPFVSDRDKQRVFPTSIKNMRKRIQGVGERDRTYLPLWMRSIQDNALTEPGYVKALVLCYVQPRQSDIIMSRIKYSNFDFKTIDLEMDRYVIDVLDKQFQDQYLAFPTHSLNTTTNDAAAPAAPVSSTPVIARYVFDSETASFDNAAITWDRGF